jgi:acetyltransferase-like isoleucine patch superfamily enzyme
MMRRNAIIPAICQGVPQVRRLTPTNLVALLRWLKLRARCGSSIELFFIGPRCRFRVEGHLRVGADVVFVGDANVTANGSLAIADHVGFSQGVTISAFGRVVIGRNSLFGEYASIHDNDHGSEPLNEPVALRQRDTRPVAIGENVWVGAKATILRGVSIGDNAVVAANAVVTRDVPPGATVAGVPARVIRPGRDQEDIDG